MADDFRRLTDENYFQVRDVNRELLEKAMAMRCVSYLADAKAKLLVRTVSTVGSSMRKVDRTNARLKEALERLNQEIEAHKATENELRRVTDMIERAPIMTAILRDGRIEYRNDAFAERWGAKAAENEPVADLLQSTDPELSESLIAAIRDGQALTAEGELAAEQGPFWSGVVVSPMANWGRSERVGLFIADETEKHEARLRLVRAQRLETIGRLTGGVAHDFNNALAVVMTNAELLGADDVAPDERIELATEIIESAEHAAALTRQLLTVGQRQALSTTAVSVSELAASVVQLARRSLGERYVLSLALPREPVLCACDPSSLESSLLNLIVNARDACGEFGDIDVSVQTTRFDSEVAHFPSTLSAGEYVCVRVADTGSGVSDETMGLMFEPFATTKSAADHSGLGLSIVLGFCEQSGGGVTVTSQVGEGTTVSMYLPRVDASTAGTPSGVGDSEDPRTDPPRALRILLVDDDASVARSVASLLRSIGHEVVGASTIEEALVALSTREIDCLITDMVLRHAERGVELARQAQALANDLPIVFLSGYAFDPDMRDRELIERYPLVMKPFSRQQLREAIRLALRKASDAAPPSAR